MECVENRQLIFAFLDNELDSALSLEVQQHIEHCPLCARECEIENVVGRKLARKLRQADDLPALDDATLTTLLHAGTESSPAPAIGSLRRNWKPTAATAVAASLLLAGTLLVVNRHRQAPHAAFADALVDDFDHFVKEEKPLHIVSADAGEVAMWLRNQTALAVNMPAVDPQLGTLRGGRTCKINGAPAAFAVYAVGDRLASLVVLRGSDESLARMKRIDRNGHTHWIDHRRGHTVLACRRGELVYAVVSRLAEESLTPLMPPPGG